VGLSPSISGKLSIRRRHWPPMMRNLCWPSLTEADFLAEEFNGFS
jgi:hypothetical protein